MVIHIRPSYIAGAALAVQFAAVVAGDWLRRRRQGVEETERKDLSIILPAALTLLTLLIGFSFSMAAGRYDQRKALEEEEANAIGTEYVRADLVPGQRAEIQELLKQYLDQRILFFSTSYFDDHVAVKDKTAQLQNELWAAAAAPALATPTPVTALVVSGMNDVLNSQGYTQAMFWNRLPPSAWDLMFLIATFASFLFGYSEIRASRRRLALLPVIVSLAFFLIADLDSPRGGLIRVAPVNLEALKASLQ
jgi:cell division protein FtsB